ncbi:MAG: hypothetical protein HC904_17585 [Blastochloris sp.]|nr:hypothetical protein [Blastochloris sp.]
MYPGRGSGHAGMFRDVVLAWPDLQDKYDTEWEREAEERLFGRYLRANHLARELLGRLGVEADWVTGHAGLGMLSAMCHDLGGVPREEAGKGLAGLAEGLERQLEGCRLNLVEVQGMREDVAELGRRMEEGEGVYLLADHGGGLAVWGCREDRVLEMRRVLAELRLRAQWQGEGHALHTALVETGELLEGLKAGWVEPGAEAGGEGKRTGVASMVDGSVYSLGRWEQAEKLVEDLRQPLRLARVMERFWKEGCVVLWSRGGRRVGAGDGEDFEGLGGGCGGRLLWC